MTDIERVLATYNLDISHMEPLGDRLYKLKTKTGDFVLKKSHLTPATVPMWEQVYRQAYHHGIYSVPPVYLNKDKQLFTKENDHIYYLTPWIEMADSVHDMKRVMETLAQVHMKTGQNIELKTEKLRHDLQNYLEFCRACKDKSEAYISVFESKRYMSPFELLACTQYHQLRSSIELIDTLLESMLENMRDKIRWQNCLCHGNLKREHIYCGKHIYFLNWEKACIDNPIADLCVYLNEISQHYQPDPDVFLEGFSIYNEHNELADIQNQMLLIHLLNPNEYLQLLSSYADQTSRIPMISQVQRLQHAVRPLLFGMALHHLIEEKLASAESKEESSNPS